MHFSATFFFAIDDHANSNGRGTYRFARQNFRELWWAVFPCDCTYFELFYSFPAHVVVKTHTVSLTAMTTLLTMILP